METWQQILLGAFALLLLYFFFPSAKAMLEKSKDEPKDWKGAILPVVFVIVFIVFLISTL